MMVDTYIHTYIHTYIFLLYCRLGFDCANVFQVWKANYKARFAHSTSTEDILMIVFSSWKGKAKTMGIATLRWLYIIISFCFSTWDAI